MTRDSTEADMREEVMVANATTMLPPDEMNVEELRSEVSSLRRFLDTATPYAKQRMAAGVLSGYVLKDLAGPDGQALEGTLYNAIREAALGFEHRSYCGTRGCSNRGKQVKCEDCGHPRIIREAPDWKAVESLLKFVVPEATISEEALQEEFIESVAKASLEAFDEANGHDDPTKRKTAFAERLAERFGK